MRVAITFHWADDLHPDHRTRFLDFCLTLEEAATARWLNPVPTEERVQHGPTLVFDTIRSMELIEADLCSEGYELWEFHAVSAG